MLHQSVEAGTPPGPNRDSSPSAVPWLLRYHIVIVTLASYLQKKMKFEEQFPDQYGPAWVGFGRHL